jgi:hypothetical protein
LSSRDVFSRERVQLEVIERLAIRGDAELDTVEASIASTIAKSWAALQIRGVIGMILYGERRADGDESSQMTYQGRCFRRWREMTMEENHAPPLPLPHASEA